MRELDFNRQGAESGEFYVDTKHRLVEVEDDFDFVDFVIMHIDVTEQVELQKEFDEYEKRYGFFTVDELRYLLELVRKDIESRNETYTVNDIYQKLLEGTR